eukprot:scaffold25.g5134.t1
MVHATLQADAAAARRRRPRLPAQAALAAAAAPSPGLVAGAVANSLVYAAGIRVLLKGLTWEGVASSWVLGSLVFAAFGTGGYAVVCAYFLFGTLVTRVRLKQKQAEGIAEARSGRRSLGNVLGSGFAGIVCALAALATGNVALWRVGFVASFASKMADTTSSEIGKAYGRTTYLITTLQPVRRGTEGAVTGAEAGCVLAAAVVANAAESYVGAVEQGRVAWLTNDVVNVLQISLAAGLAIALRALLLRT